MSSHVLPDVDEVCERVVIIRNGEVIKASSVQELRAGRNRSLTVIFRTAPASDFSLHGADVISKIGSTWEFTVGGDINDVIHALSKCDVYDITYERLTLDKLFQDLYTGGGENDQ